MQTKHIAVFAALLISLLAVAPCFGQTLWIPVETPIPMRYPMYPMGGSTSWPTFGNPYYTGSMDPYNYQYNWNTQTGYPNTWNTQSTWTGNTGLTQFSNGMTGTSSMTDPWATYRQFNTGFPGTLTQTGFTNTGMTNNPWNSFGTQTGMPGTTGMWNTQGFPVGQTNTFSGVQNPTTGTVQAQGK